MEGDTAPRRSSQREGRSVREGDMNAQRTARTATEHEHTQPRRARDEERPASAERNRRGDERHTSSAARGSRTHARASSRASENLSELLSDLENDNDENVDISNVVTDSSVSSSMADLLSLRGHGASSDHHPRGSSRKRAANRRLEREELIRQNEVLRLELSQRSMAIEELRVSCEGRVAELEEKLKDEMHSRHVMQLNMDTVVRRHQEEYQRMQETTQRELMAVRKRQQEVEAQNPLLRERVEDIKKELASLNISEARFIELKALPEDSLSIRDFVLVKFFEVVQTHKSEASSLSKQNDELRDRLAKKEAECDRRTRAYETLASSSTEKEKDLRSDVAVLEKKVPASASGTERHGGEDRAFQLSNGQL
eukprot:Opistho-2@68352